MGGAPAVDTGGCIWDVSCQARIIEFVTRNLSRRVLMVVRWLRFGFLECFCGRWWNMGCIDSYSMSINGCPITGGS